MMIVHFVDNRTDKNAEMCDAVIEAAESEKISFCDDFENISYVEALAKANEYAGAVELYLYDPFVAMSDAVTCYPNDPFEFE